jgi:5-methylthioadenosine/S-adenosylhomocysteine deaminase
VQSGDVGIVTGYDALRLATMGGARALGMEDDIGSLEVGKKADLIVVNAWQPHLVPGFMSVHRLVHEAAGQDVETVIVDGRVLLEWRRPVTVSEDDVLEQAEAESRAVIARAGLEPFMTPPDGFWGGAYARLADDRAEHIPR